MLLAWYVRADSSNARPFFSRVGVTCSRTGMLCAGALPQLEATSTCVNGSKLCARVCTVPFD